MDSRLLVTDLIAIRELGSGASHSHRDVCAGVLPSSDGSQVLAARALQCGC